MTLPTKAQEIATYKEWVESLQQGTYLHGMFAKTVPQVANEIANDFMIGPVQNVVEACRLAREELDWLKRQKEELEAEVKNLRQEAKTLQQAKAEAKRLAKILNDLSS